MPQVVTCNFAKGGLRGEKFTKDYVVYKYPEDKDLPGFPDVFIPNDLVKKIFSNLKVGMYIETCDGYVVPVIKSSSWEVRIPHGGIYQKNSVAYKGLKVYFDPPFGVKFDYKNTRGSQRKILKSAKQVKFCFAMAQDWDVERAAKIAGLDVVTVIGNNFLSDPVIQRYIMSAIALHMKASQIGEEYVVSKKAKLINELGELNQLIKDNIKEMFKPGSQVDKDELSSKLGSLLKLSEQVSSEVNDFASWLGYGVESQASPEVQGNVFQYFGGENGNKSELKASNSGLLPTKNNFDNVSTNENIMKVPFDKVGEADLTKEDIENAEYAESQVIGEEPRD